MVIVGAKGQVVIEKGIRDRLGIKPGWRAVQYLVGDHVEIHFLPPPREGSLYGSLAPYTDVRLGDKPWHEIKQEAWAAAAEERVRRMEEAEEEYRPREAEDEVQDR